MQLTLSLGSPALSQTPLLIPNIFVDPRLLMGMRFGKICVPTCVRDAEVWTGKRCVQTRCTQTRARSHTRSFGAHQNPPKKKNLIRERNWDKVSINNFPVREVNSSRNRQNRFELKFFVYTPSSLNFESVWIDKNESYSTVYRLISFSVGSFVEIREIRC